MKSTIAAFGIFLASAQSMAMTVAEFVESQPSYIALAAKQSETHACGGFGEIGFDDKTTLMRDLSSPTTSLTEKAALKLALLNWPSEYQTIYSGRAECSDRIGGQGISATVGQRPDGSFSLINIEKTDRR